ncbi:hypothetical protein OQJ18_14380 [Fluoribacter dumoffii]|uniref:hypothetical protein n=1 Tax=Fluoribacter dumoffii TaxID=463 RepID=UPI002244CFC7|nr:hypothetical protein [Fluoribacter dumoffii]MCW8416713.1 hypothetical protein [Fluoribacter dumoffii]MCW8455447.1 hypothetical protein [Fluoribacter dumoffii]MCW8460475.1 hypothetical protein [Fluoribacter dumoffii]
MKIKTFLLLLCSPLLAPKINAAVPPALMFHNKPVDALCFFNFEGKEIDLERCGLAKTKYGVKGHNSNLMAKGYIGYNWQDPEDPGPAEGYSYYKFFSAGKNLYWVYTINSGGGTGEFTTLYQVKRKNTTTLEAEMLIGGDRCNGGIQNVSLENHHLIFSQNLTAFDFIALSKTSAPQLKAYDDLAACAICCVAEAYYELNSDAKLQLNYVDLGTVNDIKEMPEQGALQPCFNQLLVAYAAGGKRKLKQNMLDEFAAKFMNTCKKPD